MAKESSKTFREAPTKVSGKKINSTATEKNLSMEEPLSMKASL